MKIKDLATEFTTGGKASQGNVKVKDNCYYLFGNKICQKTETGYYFNWCGYHTRTTARHMNNILSRINAKSVSHVRDAKTETFSILY